MRSFFLFVFIFLFDLVFLFTFLLFGYITPSDSGFSRIKIDKYFCYF